MLENGKGKFGTSKEFDDFMSDWSHVSDVFHDKTQVLIVTNYKSHYYSSRTAEIMKLLPARSWEKMKIKYKC